MPTPPSVTAEADQAPPTAPLFEGLGTRVFDAVELDDYAGPAEQPRRDQYVHYTHELPALGAESATRVLVRVVPLIYGALLGHLIGAITVGIALGAVLSMAFDIGMGQDSLLRGLYRRIVTRR